MAGTECPKCKKLTFFKTTTGRKCSKCGWEMREPARTNGKLPGPGKRCSSCGKMQVFNNKCRNCGVEYGKGK